MGPDRRDMRRAARWGGLLAVAACVLAFGPVARGDDDGAVRPPAADHAGAGGLAFDAAGRLYAADRREGRVAILGFADQPLGEIGAGVLRRPTGVAVGAGGTVVVSDLDGVHRFAPDGTPAGGFAADAPAAVALGPDGSVFVSEPGRVARFAADGTPIGSIPVDAPRGLAVAADGTLWIATRGGVVRRTLAGVPLGTADADHPEGVAAAPDGTVLVVERDRGRVARLAADGARLAEIEDNFHEPAGVAVDCRGNVAVSDDGKRRIHRIAVSPAALPPCTSAPAPATQPVRPVARRLTAVPTAPALAPVLGRAAVATPLGGTVRVRRPAEATRSSLIAAGLLPIGTRIDTIDGRVRLVFATDTEHFDTLGTTQSADVDSGVFAIRQRGGRSLVELRLAGTFPACGQSGSARPVGPRHLWADARGSFRTRGRLAIATARNARWLTEDRCDGTLVRVVRGSVQVRDLLHTRTVRVQAGGRYLARPRVRR
jgi:sugar lactone lactonase YvrE